MAAQLTATKGPPERGPERCSELARRPLPVPVSPWIRIGGNLDEARARPMSRSTLARRASITGLSPSTACIGPLSYPRAQAAVQVSPAGSAVLHGGTRCPGRAPEAREDIGCRACALYATSWIVHRSSQRFESVRYA